MLGCFQICLEGLVIIWRTWCFVFLPFCTFHTSSHELTDLHVCQTSINSHGKTMDLQTFVCQWFKSILENQVSTTPATFHFAYIHQAHLPSLVYTSVHLSKMTKCWAVFKFVLEGLVIIWRTWCFVFLPFCTFHTSSHELTDLVVDVLFVVAMSV